MRTSTRISLVLTGFAVAASGFLTGPASAATDQMQPYVDNLDCADFAPDGATWNQFTIDTAPANGTYSVPGSDLDIVISDATETSLSWASNFDMAAVLMKGGSGGNDGGPSGNAYFYPGTADLSDTNLVTPVNPNGNQIPAKRYGISHVTFCWETGGAVPGDPDVPKNDDGPQDDPTPQGDGGPQGDPTPEGDGGPQEDVIPQGDGGPQGDSTPQPGGTDVGSTDEVRLPFENQPVADGVKVLDNVETRPELPRTGVNSILLAGAGSVLVALGLVSRVAARVRG